MSLGSFISALLKKAPQPERAKEPERIALSKIEKDIDELEAALRASEAETLPVTDDAFLPDSEFLNKIKGGYVSQIRKNYPSDLIDSHLKHGYLQLSSIEFDIPHTRVTTLRKILKSKGLNCSGEKGELAHRVLENFNEAELRVFALESHYFLTELGEKAVHHYLITESRARLSRAIELTRPIAHGDLQTVSEMLRPSPTSTSSRQKWPEGIWRYINDVGCDDGILLVAIVEMRFIDHYQVVFSDFRNFGYQIDEDELLSGFAGSCAYYEVLVAEDLECYCKIHACSCPDCQKMDGKVFSPSEAKVGVTLPPFSKQCRCLVMLEKNPKAK